MFHHSLLPLLRIALGLMMLVSLVGCSGDAPLAPISLDKVLTPPGACPDCPQVNFAARIELLDQNRRELRFFGRPDTVIALVNAEFIRVKAGNEIRVQFGDLQFNDSVEVNAYRHQNGDVYADRIRIRQTDSSCVWDLAFRDEIVTIDYAAGTFTVAGRSELITTGDNTIIWGTLNTGTRNALGDGEPNQARDNLKNKRDTLYTFTDLQIGDVIEVKAVIIDAATLMAVKITIANCNERQCVRFTASIATLDVAARTITFTEQPWNGWVCPQALLTDADGNALSLVDFAVGESVAVKGLPTGDNELRISEMVKLGS